MNYSTAIETVLRLAEEAHKWTAFMATLDADYTADVVMEDEALMTFKEWLDEQAT